MAGDRLSDPCRRPVCVETVLQRAVTIAGDSVMLGKAGLSHAQELRSPRRHQPDWGRGKVRKALQSETSGRTLGNKKDSAQLV